MELFKNISWIEFFVTLAAIAAAYYLLVGLLFFRKEIRTYFDRRQEEDQADVIPDEEHRPTGTDEDAFSELEAVVNEIRFDILEKAGKGASKEILMHEIRQKLESYDGLRIPAYQYALSNFIVHQAKDLCGVVISEEELEEDWQELLRNSPGGQRAVKEE